MIKKCLNYHFLKLLFLTMIYFLFGELNELECDLIILL